MSIKHLDKLFKPRSVAVIGASNRPGSIGALITRNLLQGGFNGPIMPVNPAQQAVAGVLAYPDVPSLPVVPDLAVVCTPPATVPGLIDALGAKGTRAAIVITAGLGAQRDDSGQTLQQAMLNNAHTHQMRLLGPNCLGLLAPHVGLNASFAHLPARPGRIAFVSQSGALCTAVLDWAEARGIGFSYFISLGDGLDADFGDVIDFLGSDSETRAILLYIESIRLRRNFMSAARAAARNKPIVVIKSGRAAEGAKAAASHTGALAGADDVYDAAFRRAGMLRVYGIEELFSAVETLARAKPLDGERLCVLTNGGGIGVMAIDALIAQGGSLAHLSENTIAALDANLPPTWSRGNPVDIIGDAPGERYRQAARILADAEEVDALLVMHAPTATADASEAARATIEAAQASEANILTSWVGATAVREPRRLFNAAGVPTHNSPESAVTAFMHMVHYRRNQEMLMQTTQAASDGSAPATATARLLLENVLASGETDMLSEAEAKAVLAAYGVPTVETHIARSPTDAEVQARKINFPAALKILSNDISHKSDVGGVELFLESPQAVRKAAEKMLERVVERAPDAQVQGFTVQEMAIRPRAHELILGVATDPIFGPVILFGQGGTAVEVVADRAVALPPLNMNLARELVSRTRIHKLLKGYRDRPPVDMDALCDALLKISQIVVDIPEVVELDINPLLADENGVVAVDARIRVASPVDQGQSRLAITPYPRNLEERWRLGDRPVILRPIRPEDTPRHYAFLDRIEPEDMRFRFYQILESLPPSEMARLTQIDYHREMAFIASAPGAGGAESETLGVVRMATDRGSDACDFSIIVRSDLKGSGLGGRLMEKMIRYCRMRGLKTMKGLIMPDNKRMLAFVRRYGFQTNPLPDGKLIDARLALT